MSPYDGSLYFAYSDNSNKETQQHTISVKTSVKTVANFEEHKSSNIFSGTKPLTLFLHCDRGHSHAHEVPVILHIWKLYF